LKLSKKIDDARERIHHRNIYTDACGNAPQSAWKTRCSLYREEAEDTDPEHIDRCKAMFDDDPKTLGFWKSIAPRMYGFNLRTSLELFRVNRITWLDIELGIEILERLRKLGANAANDADEEREEDETEDDDYDDYDDDEIE
jgi:hypothetical protein